MTDKGVQKQLPLHASWRHLLIYILALSGYLLLPFVLILAFGAISAGGYWEWLNGIGFVAFALCLYLFVERARPKTWPRLRGDLFYWWHRLLAFAMLFFSTVHGVGFLVLEPTSLEYLSLRAPWHMLVAWLAWILFAYLCFASLRPFRRRLHGKHYSFRVSHALCSIVAMLASFYHIVGSDFYLKSYIAWAACSILLVLFLLYYGLNRQAQKMSLSKALLGETDEARMSLSGAQKTVLSVYLFVCCAVLSGGLYVVTR
ncbi:ferric reductase-like transmembrane domain-containing protein [Pseudoteredinibacter isoporae]|uniref:Ca2+/Na+ antiporter n=1 Tax=Pseudoteredinibacter isoporae TaxID=570281 RepID=A0A7X0JSD7_9GAMM|nr:ferric reductase-like transmembrane domain-containing protein [Pseudoteredinibacter isoporae]MBB6520525.1 Ca2+/Na+ antiporter [Pseudoteredinibacter isoporae]NHO86092.1 hypothetical protein [Pseudoteredinibacter isoporae]NIB25457.1 hypothetical protein [Pseudoteredinibacter isoporae]